MTTTPTSNDNKVSFRANATWMFMGLAARLVIQAVYFVIMARSLGAQQYGAFVAVTAAAAIASPFVGFGCGSLMIRNVARDRGTLPENLGGSILITAWTGMALSLVVGLVCLLALPATIPTLVIVLVTLSDTLVIRFVDVASWAFQAVEKLAWTARLNVFASLTRLGGLITIVVLHHPTVLAWSIAYLVTAFISSGIALYLVIATLGRPSFVTSHWRRDIREGFYFSAGACAQSIYNDIDKTMLARGSTLDAAGIYAAAYRVIEVAFIPIRAVLAAAYPGFFRSGQRRIAGSLEFAKTLIPKTVLYSVVIAIALLVFAPIIPVLMGPEFARSVEALRWLALLPLFKTVHYFAADSLAGAGFQGLRTAMQIVVAVLNVAANLWVIPKYGWRGVAWTSLACDGLLALLLWGCVAAISRRDKRSVKSVAASSSLAGVD